MITNSFQAFSPTLVHPQSSVPLLHESSAGRERHLPADVVVRAYPLAMMLTVLLIHCDYV